MVLASLNELYEMMHQDDSVAQLDSSECVDHSSDEVDACRIAHTESNSTQLRSVL